MNSIIIPIMFLVAGVLMFAICVGAAIWVGMNDRKGKESWNDLEKRIANLNARADRIIAQNKKLCEEIDRRNNTRQ